MLIAVPTLAYLILQTDTASGPKKLLKDKPQEKCIVEQVPKWGLTLSPLILMDKEKPWDHSSRLKYERWPNLSPNAWSKMEFSLRNVWKEITRSWYMLLWRGYRLAAEWRETRKHRLCVNWEFRGISGPCPMTLQHHTERIPVSITRPPSLLEAQFPIWPVCICKVL